MHRNANPSAPAMILALLIVMVIPCNAQNRALTGLAAQTSRNTSIAGVYLDSALDLERTGKTSEALNMIRRGIQIDASQSDLLYALSRIGKDHVKAIQLAVLQQALNYGNFRRFTQIEAAVDYLQVLLRQKRPSEAREYLIQNYSTRQILDTPDLARSLAQSLIALGHTGQAHALLEQAFKIHPRYPGLWAVYVRSMQIPPLNASIALGRISNTQARYYDFITAMSDGLGPGPERLALVGQLIKAGMARPIDLFYLAEDELLQAETQARLEVETDATALDEAFEQTRARIEQQAVSRFIQARGIQDAQALMVFTAWLKDPKAKQDLMKALNTGNLLVRMDRDQDKHYDEYFWFTDGKLQRWSSDRNQDGLFESDSQWKNGQPQLLVVQNHQIGEYWCYDYAETYPSATSLRRRHDDYLFSYRFSSRESEFPFVQITYKPETVLDYLGMTFQPLPTPKLEDVLESAWWLDSWSFRAFDDDPMAMFAGMHQKPEPWAPLESEWIDKDFVLPNAASNKVSLESFTPRPGYARAQFAIEKGLFMSGRHATRGGENWDKLYVFVNGSLQFGMRDIDGSATFPVVEEYDTEGLREVRYREGAWSYRIDPRQNFFDWDLDGNGVMDIRELQIGWQRVWRAWSPRGDETFNQRLR